MRFNEKKFFTLAKEKGLEAVEFCYDYSKNTSFSIFHNEVESYQEDESYIIFARGIYHGRSGTATSEKLDGNTIDFLLDNIIKNASLIENNDPCLIFKGSKKYHKKNVFNKSILLEDIPSKIAYCKTLEKKLKAYDKRIDEVCAVTYEKSYVESLISNSYGLRLKDKMATHGIAAEVTAKQGDEVKSGYYVYSSLNEDFDEDKFIKKVCGDAIKQLGATQCDSKKYPTILSQDVAATLIKSYLSNMDAEKVQKKVSLFADKLLKPIANKKLTIVENPLEKNIFFNYHDDEGVATSKRCIVKKGILQTYLYNLLTAKKDNVEPTGNGVNGAKPGVALNCIYIKPGKKSFNDMISNVKCGVYINDISGLHAGMNAQSGNFSLQAQGNMIRDGKIAEPLSLITIAGNLVDVFNNIKDIANDSELMLSGVSCPSIYIKKMAISGK